MSSFYWSYRFTDSIKRDGSTRSVFSRDMNMDRTLKNRFYAFLWGLGSALDLSGGVDDLHVRRSQSNYDAIQKDWEIVGDYLDTARDSFRREYAGTDMKERLKNVESAYSTMQRQTQPHTDDIESLLAKLLAEYLSNTPSTLDDKDRLLALVEEIAAELQGKSRKDDDHNQLELALDDS